MRQSILLSGGLNGFGVGLTVVTSLALARALLPYDYGQLIYYYAMAGLLRLFMNLGLGTSISRDAAAHWRDQDQLSIVVFSSAAARLLSCLAGILLIVAIDSIVTIRFAPYLMMAAFWATLADFVCAVLSGSRSAGRVGLILLIQPAAYFGFAIGLVLTNRGSATWLMAGYALSFAVTAILGVILIASARVLGPIQCRLVQPSYIKKTVGFIIPSYLVGLAAAAWGTAATSAFGWLGQFDSAARFGIAFTGISLPVSIIGPAILNTYYPHASYLYRQARRAEFHSYLSQTIWILALILVWVAVLIFAFADSALIVLFGPSYAPSGTPARLMAPIVVSMGLLPVFTLTLLAIGRPWTALIGLGLQAAVLVIALLWMGDSLTPLGLGAVLLLSGAIGAAVQWAQVRRAIGTGTLTRANYLVLAVGISAAPLLRLGASRVGATLSLWHFILGFGFTALYALALLFSGQLKPRLAAG